MQRRLIDPRPDWEAKAEEIGFLHHTADGEPYWAEDRYYAFGMDEVLAIESATNELHARCLDAVQHVIDEKRYTELAIPAHAVPLIERSWNDDDPTLYGRFDFAYSGGAPKMLEYNADTPTSLLEASVAQWQWLQDRFPALDQFNSIHERLISQWAHLRPYLRGPTLYLASLPVPEDICTVNYLRDTAAQAGVETHFLPLQEIGWHEETRRFVADGDANHAIDSAFLLYPWEWMIQEAFADAIMWTNGRVQWIEPAWKMVLANKGILPILWELFPDHPNLLPAYREDYLFDPGVEYVQKPLYSREGANVTLHSPYRAEISTGGDYGEEGYVYQGYAPLPELNGWHPVIGSWVIGGEAAGMGIRESRSVVTDNLSRFVPHAIVGPEGSVAQAARAGII